MLPLPQLERGTHRRHWELPRRRSSLERGDRAPPSRVRPRLGRVRTAEAKPPPTEVGTDAVQRQGTQLHRRGLPRAVVKTQPPTKTKVSGALQARAASVQEARPHRRTPRERVHVGTSMMGSHSEAPRHTPRARRSRRHPTASPKGLMLGRVRIAEIKPPPTETGTVVVQTHLVRVTVHGTFVGARTTHGTSVRPRRLRGDASSKAHPQGITGTIRGRWWTPGGGVVRCTSCPTT